MFAVKLADVGEGLTEAKVVAWQVVMGDRVEVDDVLVEIETAQSLVELPSPVAGVVGEIHVGAGATVAVGTVLVSIEAAPTEDKPLVLVGTGPTAAPDRRRRLKPAHRPGQRSHVVQSPTPVSSETPVARASSAVTAPQVTEWLSVDVTRTIKLARRLHKDRSCSGAPITPFVLLVRAFVLVIGRHTSINARWDDAAQKAGVQPTVNLGIAAWCPRGLVVPNIKQAQEMDLRTLAQEMERLVETARAGTVTPADLAGGTITITDIGALGVDGGTPTISPGESVILALGAVRDMPWVVDGHVVPRKVAQLAISFDPRLVEREVGSRVLADVGHLLDDPGQALARL